MPGSEPFQSYQGRALKEKLSLSPKAKCILIECLHGQDFYTLSNLLVSGANQHHHYHNLLIAYSEPDVTFRDFQFPQFCFVMLFCACRVLSSIPCLQSLDTSNIPHLRQQKISPDIAEYLLEMGGVETVSDENHCIRPFVCIIYFISYNTL